MGGLGKRLHRSLGLMGKEKKATSPGDKIVQGNGGGTEESQTNQRKRKEGIEIREYERGKPMDGREGEQSGVGKRKQAVGS